MDLTMYQLRTFLDVARTGSITKSARSLGYSQSTVTAHVRSLELRVGAQLFHRLPHGVRLTAAGDTFRSYAQQILNLVDEMSSALQQDGEPSGRVTVGATASLIDSLVPSLVAEAQHRYPRVRVSPRVIASADVVPLVLDGQIDIALGLGDCGNGAQIPSIELSALEMVPVCSSADGGRRHDNDVRLVAADVGCPSHLTLSGVVKERYGVTTTVLEAGSVTSARELVVAGLGIAMLPVSIVEKAIATGELVEMDGLPRTRPFARAAWLNEEWASPAVMAILDVIRQRRFDPAQSIGA